MMNMTLTTDQITRLAEACGVQRRGRSDEVLFEACLRMIKLNLGSPA
jgi:hypothetical protein